MKRMIMICLVLSFMIPLGSSAQDARTPRHPFGIVEGYWRPEAAEELGVAWERITFDWSKIQPNGPGDYDLSFLHKEWLATDREIAGLIVNTPVWASDSGLSSGVPVGLYAPYDNPENQWAVFLRQLIPPLRDQGVHDWIIWNTPDDSAFWAGTPADFYRLLKIAAQTIRELDSEATVIFGGLAWQHEPDSDTVPFLQRVLETAQEDPSAAAAGYYFDAIALNILLGSDDNRSFLHTTDSAADIPLEVRDILDRAGLTDHEIWITELNALPTGDSAATDPKNEAISLVQQARFIVQASALALGAGVDRIAVYKLYDSNYLPGETLPWGLLSDDNRERPAFDAYEFAIDTFIPFIEATDYRSSNGRLVIIEQAEETVYVMWSAGAAAVDFWIPSNFEDAPQLYDVMGETLSDPRKSVGIDGESVFVIETLPAETGADDSIQISGPPVILRLEGPPRSVWVALEGNALQLH